MYCESHNINFVETLEDAEFSLFTNYPFQKIFSHLRNDYTRFSSEHLNNWNDTDPWFWNGW
jgi:hypothetical protein